MKIRAQTSTEYLIIVGFLIFVIIGVLGVGVFYSNKIKDNMRMNYIKNFANKVISTSESVFYAGEPSKATITAYIPEGIDSIEITENSIVFDVHTSSGKNRIAFSSNVPISGSINSNKGIKKIEVLATSDRIIIS